MAAYVKNYSGIWVPGAGGGTPITAATLNNLENQYDCAISMIIQSTTPSTQAFGDAAVVGVNTDAARSDHKTRNACQSRILYSKRRDGFACDKWNSLSQYKQ